MHQALHCNLPKANCNSPTFSQPSLETKIFVSFCNLLQQLAYRLSISCLSTTKYWVFKKIINSKEEDRTKQELFSSTRSGAVYLLHTKDQSHWFESTGEYKTPRQRNSHKTNGHNTSKKRRRHKTKTYQPEKDIHKQRKYTTQKKRKRVTCEREMRNEFISR